MRELGGHYIVGYHDVWVESISRKLQSVFAEPGKDNDPFLDEVPMTEKHGRAYYYCADSLNVKCARHVLIMLDLCDSTLRDFLSPPENLIKTTQGKLITDFPMKNH